LIVFQRFCQECGAENPLFHEEAEASSEKGSE
jgi:hypothetical protein